MSNKDHPIIATVCVVGIIAIVALIIAIIVMSMNRHKKEGFRRLVLQHMTAGNSDSPKTGKKCGHHFRGNDISYLLDKKQVPTEWDQKPSELKSETDDITPSNIAKEIANDTIQEIMEQTGVDVRPPEGNIDFDHIIDRRDYEKDLTVNGPKKYETADKINEDRSVETNVGKPVNGPVAENFNHLRISAFNSEPLESLLASSKFGAKEKDYPVDISMRAYAKQFN